MRTRVAGLALSCLGVLGLAALVVLAASHTIAAQDAPFAPSGRFPLALENERQVRVAQPGGSTSQYTLTVWHGWSGDYAQEYYDIVYEFNMAHPTMTVQLVHQPDITEALSDAVPAGQGPDVVVWANDVIGEWALAGYLTSLDPWIDQGYLTSTFEPAAAQGILWDERIWGIPESQEGIALVYNRELISDTMLPDPGDFDDLLAKAAQFQQANPTLYYVCNQGLGNQDAYHAASIYFEHGLKDYGGYLDEDGHVYLTTTAALSAAQWISDFRPYAPGSTSHSICQNMLVEGDAGAWWTGPWALADLESAGLDYGIAPMGSPFVGSRSFMMTPNAVSRGNAEAAIYFMKHFGSMEAQKRLSLANRTIPANTDALNDPQVQALYAVSAFGESLNRGTPMANHLYAGCQWEPVGDATTAIWTGAQTAQEAMNSAQVAILNCIAQLREPFRVYLPIVLRNH